MSTAVATRPSTPISWLNDGETLDKLIEASPSGFNAQQFKRSVLTSMAKTEGLAKCTLASFANCALECAQLGLSPGPSGHVYLIPRDKRKKDNAGQWVTDHTYCTIIVGYRGLLHAMRRAAPGIFVDAVHVYSGDTCNLRIAEKPDHTLALTNRGKSLGVYAMAKLPGVDIWHHLWIPREELEEIRDEHAPRDRYTKEVTGPWATSQPEMERKTALRRLAKVLPQMVLVDQMLAVEDEGPRDHGIIDVTPSRPQLTTTDANDEFGGGDE